MLHLELTSDWYLVWAADGALCELVDARPATAACPLQEEPRDLRDEPASLHCGGLTTRLARLERALHHM